MKKAKDIGPRPAHKKGEERPYYKTHAHSERRGLRSSRKKRRRKARLAAMPPTPWVWSNA